MRLWSISFKYLDRQGLLALWRESLLARKVLEGKTKGYKNHPQLNRFKNTSDPLAYINAYLDSIYQEALKRGYNFDAKKISLLKNKIKDIKVSNEQVDYEFKHLLGKLEMRNIEQFNRYKNVGNGKVKINRIFRIEPGKIESWERVKK